MIDFSTQSDYFVNLHRRYCKSQLFMICLCLVLIAMLCCIKSSKQKLDFSKADFTR